MGPLTAIGNFMQRWSIMALMVVALLAALKIAHLQADLADEKLATSNARADRESAARLHESILASRERAHATAQQEKEAKYVEDKKVWSDQYRAAVANAGRLRDKLAQATARDNQGSPTDPAACGRAFHKIDQLGQLAGEAEGLFAEAELLLRERDIDVRRLREQIDTDRAAINP